MLLKKRYGRPLSALSLSLALAFAPLFNVQAEEPEVVPGDSSATPAELSVALAQSDGQSPAVAKLAGEQPLSMATAANSRAQIEALKQQLEDIEGAIQTAEDACAWMESKLGEHRPDLLPGADEYANLLSERLNPDNHFQPFKARA